MSWITHHQDYVPQHNDDGTTPVPLYGLRMCVSLGQDGMPLYTWIWDNEADVNRFEAAGVLDALKNEMLHQHILESVRRLDARFINRRQSGDETRQETGLT